MPDRLRFESDSLRCIRLDSRCFYSINAYGALMVDKAFYQLFAEFDYILVYQLDCLVFADRLAEFCRLGYDYLAPLILARSDGCWPGSDIVGVGGFSLRRVGSFLRVLDLIENPQFSAEALSLEGRINRNGAEDMFWSLAAPVIDPCFSVANPETALAFGFEGDPRLSYSRAGKQRPFGCHHWNSLFAFLWYFPWLPLSLTQRLRLVPPVFAELMISDLIGLGRRVSRRLIIAARPLLAVIKA